MIDTIHIAVCMKPLKTSFAENALESGVAGLNIDGCRVGTEGATKRSHQADYPKNDDGSEDRSEHWARTGHEIVELDAGRYPSNIIIDGSGEVVEQFPETGKSSGGRVANISKTSTIYGGGKGLGQDIDPELVKGDPGFGDEGSAARYFKECHADD